MHSDPKPDWIPIAVLLRPQGRRGEVLAEPLSDLPEIFTSPGDLALAAPNAAPSSSPKLVQIKEHWFPTGKNSGRIVLKLSGCESISEAESLSGFQLFLPAAQLPTLDPDTFYVGDLIGCTIVQDSTAVGTITDVEFPTSPDGRTRLEDAAPLLVVQLIHDELSPSAEPVLIPFIRAWLHTVDIPARRIIMHLPDGLLYTPSANPA